MSTVSKLSQDSIKERIKFLTEIMKLLFGLLLATTAGTIALMIKYLSGTTPPKEALLILFGLAISAGTGLGISKILSDIINFIKKL